MDLHVFFKPDHQKLSPEYTTTALQEFTYFITLYGTPLSQRLNVIELPGDTVPYAWAPEMACLATRSPKKQIIVCWPTRLPINGGECRLARQRKMTGGSPMDFPATPKPCMWRTRPARRDLRKQ